MHLISRRTLREFWEKHPNAEAPLVEWCKFVERAEWRTMQDIKNAFASASFVGNNRVVFNIGGNNYRLVVVARLSARTGTLYVRFIGTHAEYDRIDVTEV